jgi:mannose-6-phosphate isomerase-like protein (cupin superfamily)
MVCASTLRPIRLPSNEPVQPTRAAQDADELFLVLNGRLPIQLRDCDITLDPGEFFIVPRGVEDKPVAEAEAHVLLFEPAGTLITGNATDERTVHRPERI